MASIFEAAQATTASGGGGRQRDAFVQLVMTNLFGQNAPLIAAEGVRGDVPRMWPPCRGTTPGHRRLPRKWCRGRLLQRFPGLGAGATGATGGESVGTGATGGERRYRRR
ncbi:hypothetical protein ACQKB4_16780 [Mycobacterium tuberculosis]